MNVERSATIDDVRPYRDFLGEKAARDCCVYWTQTIAHRLCINQVLQNTRRIGRKTKLAEGIIITWVYDVHWRYKKPQIIPCEMLRHRQLPLAALHRCGRFCALGHFAIRWIFWTKFIFYFDNLTKWWCLVVIHAVCDHRAKEVNRFAMETIKMAFNFISV